MRTVWKAVLDPEPNEGSYLTAVVNVPARATFVKAGFQNGQPVLWYQCVSERPLERRELAIVPTGGELPEGAVYIDTFFMGDMTLIWHVFEVMNSPVIER